MRIQIDLGKENLMELKSLVNWEKDVLPKEKKSIYIGMPDTPLDDDKTFLKVRNMTGKENAIVLGSLSKELRSL